MSADSLDLLKPGQEDGIVCCTIGSEQYALRGNDVRHVARADQMRVETGRDERAGTIDVGGLPVPVFELGRVLGRPVTRTSASPKDSRYVVVTGSARQPTGWIVDRIARAPVSPGTQIVPLPAVVGATATRWFEALVKLDEVSLLMLSASSLSPLAPRSCHVDPVAALVAPAPAINRRPEPMVVTFSTPALPRSAAQSYALGARQIAAIIQSLSLIAVPGSARHVLGVAWWRNTVVPVIDFRGTRADAPPCPRFLIAQTGVRSGAILVAVPIDAEITLHRAATTDRQLLDAPRPPFAFGMFDVGGQTVALLDIDTLLATNENSLVLAGRPSCD